MSLEERGAWTMARTLAMETIICIFDQMNGPDEEEENE